MERGFHELNEELGNGERTFLFFEQIHQAFPPILDG